MNPPFPVSVGTRAVISPAVTKPTPKGLPIRLPHGRFFSAAMIAPNASIQPMLPDPTANITSISDQQHGYTEAIITSISDQQQPRQ